MNGEVCKEIEEGCNRKRTDMGIVQAKDLTFEYIIRDEEDNIENVKTAVDHVSLDIEQGQFIAILGHNGSGKSTFAKHINALLSPTEGTIWVDGMDTKDEAKLWDIRQTAGMVFQNPDNQIIGTIVEEDVGFGPENLGVPTKEIWERVDASLEAVGMTEYRHHSPNKLSGGQKQRVAIAGILAMKPKCIVLDEPEAALSPQRQLTLLMQIYSCAKEGAQFIIVTHSPILLGIPDADIYCFDNGRIHLCEYEDTESYQVTEMFINNRQMLLDKLLIE